MTTTADRSPHASFLLVAGHWLGAWAWDDVLLHLSGADARAVALTLPGLDPDDPDRADRTLDEQVTAVVTALHEIRGAGTPAVLVAHSGANAPVSVVLDRHAHLVERVVWVDSGPVAPGVAFAPELPADVRELALPPFDVLGQQASLAGLDERRLAAFRARAVPEPGPVLRQPVELTDPARHRVPTTLVCCSLPSAQVLELAARQHPVFAEVARLEDVDLVDLPTGHWPMWSRPADLAQAVLAAAGRGVPAT